MPDWIYNPFNAHSRFLGHVWSALHEEASRRHPNEMPEPPHPLHLNPFNSSTLNQSVTWLLTTAV